MSIQLRHIKLHDIQTTADVVEIYLMFMSLVKLWQWSLCLDFVATHLFKVGKQMEQAAAVFLKFSALANCLKSLSFISYYEFSVDRWDSIR